MGALAPNYKQKQCDNNDALRYRSAIVSPDPDFLTLFAEFPTL
jgi:hypothetical protein